MRISDWSSDVCSSDLTVALAAAARNEAALFQPVDEIGHCRLAELDGRCNRACGGLPMTGNLLQDDKLRRRKSGRGGKLPFGHFSGAEQPSDRAQRSEERRVGKECFSTCRSRGSP